MNRLSALILQINDLYDEIILYENELEKTNSHISSPSFTGMPCAGDDSSRTENLAIHNVEIQQAVIEKSVLLISCMAETYEMIMRLPNVVSRIISLETVFLGKSTIETGRELGFTSRHVERLYREAVEYCDNPEYHSRIPVPESQKFAEYMKSLTLEQRYVLESELQQELYVNTAELLRHLMEYTNPSASCRKAQNDLEEVSSRFLVCVQYNMVTRSKKDIRRIRKRRETVSRAIDGMNNTNYRALLRFRYLEGMLWTDIADEMCYDVNYVRHLNKKALEELRKQLPEKYLHAA